MPQIESWVQNHVTVFTLLTVPRWNFEKFLVNAAGDVVARFSPGVAPEAIAEQLGELLG